MVKGMSCKDVLRKWDNKKKMVQAMSVKLINGKDFSRFSGK